MEGRPLQQPTDQQLIERARAGDLGAYDVLVLRHQEVAFRTAVLLTRGAMEAQDATQDAFVKAHAALGRFRPDAEFRPWLLAIVANEARNRRRSAGRRVALALRIAEDRPMGEAAPSPEATVLDHERRTELLAAMARLGDDDRVVIGCRYLLELSEAETAEVLRVPKGTVKSRLSRGLARLRVELERGARAGRSVMTEPIDPRAMATLEDDLRALAGAVAWPPTPDVRAPVRLRITAAPAQARASRRPSPFRLTRPLLLAIVLLALAAAIAAAVILGLPGLRIAVVDTLPTPNVPVATATRAPDSTPSGSADLPGANLQLGRVVSLAEAARVLGRPILLPDLPGADEPDAVYLTRIDGAPVVTLTWGVRPDLPPASAGSDVGLLITQFEATIDEGLMTKALDQGSTVEAVRIGAHRGLWISGAAHVLFFRRSGRDAIESVIRLVGDTLAIEWDGRIVRLESALGRDRSLELAATLR